MSRRNGDRARFHKEQRRKMLRRQSTQKLMAALKPAGAAAADATAATPIAAKASAAARTPAAPKTPAAARPRRASAKA
jgi:hypothetical protein